MPRKRAYWGAYVITLAVLRHKGAGPLPAVLAAMLAAEAAGKAWQAMEDIHALAEDSKRETAGAAQAD